MAKEGRPTKYRKEYCALLLEHMKDGLSFESFGGIVGVARHTLYDWEKVHPEFLHAKKEGESGSRLYWEKVGRDGLYNETIKDGDGMTVTKSINATIWIFNMKNRFKWRDKTEEEDEPEKLNSTLPTADLLAIIRGNK